MKKTFSTNVANKKPARQVDSIKHEINKYVSRERRKDLPEGFDFWDFKCAIGAQESEAVEIHLKEINAKIDELVSSGKVEFFLSVIGQPRKRTKKSN